MIIYRVKNILLHSIVSSFCLWEFSFCESYFQISTIVSFFMNYAKNTCEVFFKCEIYYSFIRNRFWSVIEKRWIGSFYKVSMRCTFLCIEKNVKAFVFIYWNKIYYWILPNGEDLLFIEIVLKILRNLKYFLGFSRKQIYFAVWDSI